MAAGSNQRSRHETGPGVDLPRGTAQRLWKSAASSKNHGSEMAFEARASTSRGITDRSTGNWRSQSRRRLAELDARKLQKEIRELLADWESVAIVRL